ncbi:hypothetical protein QR680_014162 [Steinernema hermaphroditum]|uniref:Uncharacterized protein n=1 Tax=Steinernema hermaphroditum TaxID=289476 RepID=A0AA39I7W8_9BILA|nr:hypothetical protein QR680_014162 [Steinernema hermaphroditum]
MDSIPPAFYDELFPTLELYWRMCELSGPVGRMARQFEEMQKYYVTAYIADHLYVIIGGSSTDHSLEELPYFFAERKKIQSIDVVVFAQFPDKRQEEEKQAADRERFRISEEVFDRVMQLFVYAPNRTVSFFEIDPVVLNRNTRHAVDVSKAHITNFNAFKKYLAVCHEIYCDFEEYGLSQFYKFVPEYLRCPTLRTAWFLHAKKWSEDMMDAIFDFMCSPHIQYIHYKHYVEEDPPDFVSKWMSLDDKLPSRGVINFYAKDVAILNKFVFYEISRESIEELSPWLEGEVHRLERDVWGCCSHGRFFKMRHPTHRRHSVVVAIEARERDDNEEHENMSREELFATTEISDFYFI